MLSALNILYKATVCAVLFCTRVPLLASDYSIVIYINDIYPLIINSTEKQKQSSARPSDITQQACEHVQITYTELRHSCVFEYSFILL